ncbi:hypothetical protein ACIBEF_25230 [Micromonospora sp. NPDC050795]|uniref:hypothetical protein n=1 Tax=Micromonospora sp. NPDC050795 TaxID=3364282 RepID=UPI00378E51E2
MAIPACLSLAATLAFSAPAHAAEQGYDPAIAAALDRVADGSWTDADIQLIQGVPEVGQAVPDPRDEGTVSEVKIDTSPNIYPPENAPGTYQQAAAATTRCKDLTVSIDKKDFFGSRIYRFNTRTEWCYNGSKVTGIYRKDGWISNNTWGIYFRSWSIDSSSTRPDGSAYHDKRANLDYCVAYYGCYTQTHPYVYLKMYKTGGYEHRRYAG